MGRLMDFKVRWYALLTYRRLKMGYRKTFRILVLTVCFICLLSSAVFAAGEGRVNFIIRAEEVPDKAVEVTVQNFDTDEKYKVYLEEANAFTGSLDVPEGNYFTVMILGSEYVGNYFMSGHEPTFSVKSDEILTCEVLFDRGESITEASVEHTHADEDEDPTAVPVEDYTLPDEDGGTENNGVAIKDVLLILAVIFLLSVGAFSLIRGRKDKNSR